jgi:hypothetical protein
MTIDDISPLVLRIIQPLFVDKNKELLAINKKAKYFESNEDNLKLAQLFRIAFKFEIDNHNTNLTKRALNKISGGLQISACEMAFEFFQHFWSIKLGKCLDNNENRQLGNREQFQLLNDNLQLLNFHLVLIREKFFNSTRFLNNILSAQLFKQLIDMFVKLIRVINACFKRFILFIK